jgi:hypothetical protein
LGKVYKLSLSAIRVIPSLLPSLGCKRERERERARERGREEEAVDHLK